MGICDAENLTLATPGPHHTASESMGLTVGTCRREERLNSVRCPLKPRKRYRWHLGHCQAPKPSITGSWDHTWGD